MLIEQQIAERQTRAKDAVEHILERPASGLYGDYRIRSASKKIYRVALRGPGLFENYCSCPDFAINTLGTCKHIEAVLLRLRQKHGSALEREKFQRTRASISLHYGETVGIRLRLPAKPSTALQALAMLNDRFIIRQFSPVVTIGGGTLLDAATIPRMPGHEAFLEVLARAEAPAIPAGSRAPA